MYIRYHRSTEKHIVDYSAVTVNPLHMCCVTNNSGGGLQFSLTAVSICSQTFSLSTPRSSPPLRRNLSWTKLRSGFLGNPSSSNPSRGIPSNSKLL